MQKKQTIAIIFHSGVLQKGHKYYMKEVWAEYIRTSLMPNFDCAIFVTPITRDLQNTFLTCEIDSESFGLRTLPELSGHCKVRLVEKLIVYLRVYLNAIRTSSVVWIFFPCGRGFLAAIFSQFLGKPYVCYLGGDWAELTGKNRLNRWLKRRMELFVVQGSRFTLARGSYISNRNAKYSQKIFPAIAAIKLKVTDIYHRELRWPLGDVRCLYVGGLLPMKGLEYLLKAIKLLIDRGYERISLGFIGTGHSESVLLQWIDELGLSDNVYLRGYVPNGSSLFALYKQADIFILPTLSEGFPRVLIEAMAFGLAIITTPVGGIPDVMHHEENCLFVPVRCPNEIADAVEHLTNDGELFTRLVMNGYRTAEELLTQDASAQIRDLLLRFQLLEN